MANVAPCSVRAPSLMSSFGGLIQERENLGTLFNNHQLLGAKVVFFGVRKHNTFSFKL